jgi:FkbH-like protein
MHNLRNKQLSYPFDSKLILRRRKRFKRELLEGENFTNIKVAVLGGSTTSEIINLVELFLLDNGIRPTFYESEYNRYFEDALFAGDDLEAFGPDIILVHTSVVNVTRFPGAGDSAAEVDQQIAQEVLKFEAIWDALARHDCAIIQNNFDLPSTRPMGNLDGYSHAGRVNFVNRLNAEFARAADRIRNLYLNDIHYLSSDIGLRTWFDPALWHLSKYAVSFEAMPDLAHNVSRIIRAILGRSYKCLVLDLDNTCWAGVIGDDGISGIQIGPETALGEAYTAFQAYAKALQERGVTLAVCSKNEMANAQEGFNHPETILRLSDFTVFKANWDPKYINIEEIATTLNVGIDSLVFVDDNPAERDAVSSQIPSVAVPDVGSDVIDFVLHIDRNGYFETVTLSADDMQRNAYYQGNAKRHAEQVRFASYDDFLKSLEMKAIIRPFEIVYLDRITQLTNKTNQFNLTTRRYTAGEISAIAKDPCYVTLYGKLLDKHGDNGLVAISLGRIDSEICHIDLWLMSCRVLKRGMERAMLDRFVAMCREKGVSRIMGYYARTPKNSMVADLYADLGFTLLERSETKSTWQLDVADYADLNENIRISDDP